MKSRFVSRAMVFVLSLLVWLLITSFTNMQELIVGAAVALVVSLVGGDLLAPHGIRLGIGKIFHSIAYLFVLIWEIFKANLNVAYIVLHPKLPIRPGIVRVKTGLTSDAALTMLANSITLTPGTLTVDIDKEQGLLYVHWITVAGGDTTENTSRIVGRFEERLKEIFQ